MPKNMSTLLTNNIIAIVVHVCMCFAFLFPLSYIWGFGVWFDDRSPELMDVIINLFVIGIYITLILFLYFWAGKKFLSKTQHTPTNILSVMVLAIIIIMITIIAYDSIWERILRLPFYLLGETMSYFFQIEGKYCYLILSFFPSLTMLAGMTIKWEKFRSFWQKGVETSKTNTLLIANNLIAIAIHMYMCFIFLIPVDYMWSGDIWFESWRWNFEYVFVDCLAIIIFTIAAFCLYFLSGRKFLRNIQHDNILINASSVMVLIIIISVTTFVVYGSFWEELLKLPFYPLGATISYFLQIEEKYVFLIMSILPSLTMLAGMMTKRKENHLPLSEVES